MACASLRRFSRLCVEEIRSASSILPSVLNGGVAAQRGTCALLRLSAAGPACIAFPQEFRGVPARGLPALSQSRCPMTRPRSSSDSVCVGWCSELPVCVVLLAGGVCRARDRKRCKQTRKQTVFGPIHQTRRADVVGLPSNDRLGLMRVVRCSEGLCMRRVTLVRHPWNAAVSVLSDVAIRRNAALVLRMSPHRYGRRHLSAV